MITFQQLKYFATIVERGSLNKAARELFISQPALTKQLAQLENELDCSLFIRKTAGIELTDEGRYVYGKACVILEQVNQTIQGVKRCIEVPNLRIGALPSLASYYLPNLLNNVIIDEKYKVDIITRDTTNELICMLKDKRKIDFIQRTL